MATTLMQEFSDLDSNEECFLPQEVADALDRYLRENPDNRAGYEKQIRQHLAHWSDESRERFIIALLTLYDEQHR